MQSIRLYRGKKMVLRIINRYVERVVDRLPFWVKRRAKVELKKVILDILDDYCGGEVPTGHDVRAVLVGLGSPERLAEQYYNIRSKSKKHRKRNIRKTIHTLQIILIIVAAILIITGIVTLAAGLTSNMMTMLIGLLLALCVVIVQNFIPQKEQSKGVYNDRLREYKYRDQKETKGFRETDIYRESSPLRPR